LRGTLIARGGKIKYLHPSPELDPLLLSPST
jgi:hypothetical protein